MSLIQMILRALLQPFVVPENLNFRRNKWIWMTFICFAAVVPTIAHATGFRIFNQSASAGGQANAFTAQSDDPSAIAYNPAGMTQIKGVQLMVGTLMAGGGTDFTNSATGATSHGEFGGPFIRPRSYHIYITGHLGELFDIEALERVTAGVGLLSPYGNGYEWPKDGPLNTSLVSSRLPLIDIRPVIAYKATDQLSIGVGADIYTFQDRAKTEFISAGGLIPPGTPVEINGEDTKTGFNLSLLYTPCLSEGSRSWCSFGFQYRSKASLQLEGQLLAAGTEIADAQTRLVLPQSYTLGFAVWPILNSRNEWKLEVDVDKTDWSAFDNTDVRLSNGTTIDVPRNWNDTITLLVGSEYKWIGAASLTHWNIAARTGYAYAPTPVPSRTFDPAVAGADSHIFSIGLGFLCKPGGQFAGLIPCGNSGGWYNPSAISLDLAYSAVIRETRRINDNVPPLTSPTVVNGTYETLHHVGLISMRVNF